MSLLLASSAQARGGRGSDTSDRADRAIEQSQRDTSRQTERALQDQARDAADRAKITEDAVRDPRKAAEDLARVEEDRLKDVQDATEDATKAAEDAARDAADAAEDAAKDAEDAAEDAADQAARFGSSAGMKDVGNIENPDKDSRGFPVRRGEIVTLDLGDDAVKTLQLMGYRVIARDALPSLGGNLTRIALPAGVKPEKALADVRRIEPLATADYTHYYAMQVTPSGTASGNAKAPKSRREGHFAVGMIDTGITRHDALLGATITARDFSTGSGNIPTEHGTAIASLLVQDGAKTIVAANIFRGGTGAPFTSAENVAAALDWLAGSKVPVINMSLAGPRNAILDRLVQKTIASGSKIVAAAGNGGPGAPPAYPAALPSVVAVTAVDSKMRIYRYANQGPYLDVASLGVGETAAKAGAGYALFSGTSFATPHVAAWMASCMRDSSGNNCEAKLFKSARDLGLPGRDPVYGHGFVK